MPAPWRLTRPMHPVSGQNGPEKSPAKKYWDNYLTFYKFIFNEKKID
jgi:hypothetical protein